MLWPRREPDDGGQHDPANCFRVVMAVRLGMGAGAAVCVRVDVPDDLPAALAAGGLSNPRPVLVLVGGAGGLSPAEQARLTPLFVHGLVPAVERSGAAVVDGGTDSGVMRLLGEARAASRGQFPLVGVVAEETVRLPDGGAARDDAADLEAHHTLFVVVPGADWGSEAPWIQRTATQLARTAPSMTVLVNGGDIAFGDAFLSVEASRPVLVIAGSGRSADLIAAALRGETADARARDLAASHLVSQVDVDDPEALCAAVTRALALAPR